MIESFIFGKDFGGHCVRMKDEDTGETKWYAGDPSSAKFADEIAEAVIDGYGERAHLYALEAFMNSKNEQEADLWKSVLTKLDKE